MSQVSQDGILSGERCPTEPDLSGRLQELATARHFNAPGFDEICEREDSGGRHTSVPSLSPVQSHV